MVAKRRWTVLEDSIPRAVRYTCASCNKEEEKGRGGTAGRSPFSVFVDVLKEELQKSKAMQDNVRQLQGETTKAMDSEAMKRARQAYERARLATSIKENPRLRAAAEAVQKGGGVVTDAVAEAVRSVEESSLYRGGKQVVRSISSTVFPLHAPR